MFGHFAHVAALGLPLLAPAAEILLELRLMLLPIGMIIVVELLDLALAPFRIMRIVLEAAAVAVTLLAAAATILAEQLGRVDVALRCAPRRRRVARRRTSAAARHAPTRSVARIHRRGHRVSALAADMARVDPVEAAAIVVRPAEARSATARIILPALALLPIHILPVRSELTIEMIVAPSTLIAEAAAEACPASLAAAFVAPAFAVVVIAKPRADLLARTFEEAAILVTRAAAIAALAVASPVAIAAALALRAAAALPAALPSIVTVTVVAVAHEILLLCGGPASLAHGRSGACGPGPRTKPHRSPFQPGSQSVPARRRNGSSGGR